MSYPKVSVLVRSMDRPTLERSLDSIVRQGWPNLEIVLVAACARAHRPFASVWRGRPLRFVMPAALRALALIEHALRLAPGQAQLLANRALMLGAPASG